MRALIALDLTARRIEQRVDLRRARARSREPGGIEIEVQAEHHRTLRPHLRELAQQVLGHVVDRAHRPGGTRRRHEITVGDARRSRRGSARACARRARGAGLGTYNRPAHAARPPSDPPASSATPPAHEQPVSERSRNPLIPRRQIDQRQELPALELQVLQRWRERDVFAESLNVRRNAPAWVFYEGPPTANGPPGSHHVLSRVFKDIYPRFKTMCGYRVERKGGWDCHGLPVEIAVEEELGIRSKAEVERYGIREFNERCRASVLAYVQEWDRLTERIGF